MVETIFENILDLNELLAQDIDTSLFLKEEKTIKKKKVMIFVPLLGAEFGGSPKVASNLSIELSNTYEVVIVTITHQKELYPFKGKYYTLNARNETLGMLAKLNTLKRIVQLEQPDLIITFMHLSSYWLIPLTYSMRLKTPLVISMHSNPDIYGKRIHYKFLVRLLYRLKRVSAIIPVSKSIKTILNRKYKIPKSKILPIYNGIDINEVRTLANRNTLIHKEIFEDQNIFKFITVGRLSGEKGHISMINAFSKVKRTIPNTKLIIIGEGLLRNNLEDLIQKRELKNDVILMGFIKNPFKYVKRSDVFVLSSLYEGLPYTLIEALICKIPIISTDCETGPREILENGKYGVLTKVGDSKELAEKMISLAKDSNKRAFFSEISEQKIRDFQSSRFSRKWQKLVEFFTNSYSN